MSIVALSRSTRLRATVVVALGIALVGPAFPGAVPAAEASTTASFATHGSRSVKSIALTIDDCDNHSAVTALVEILEKERVNATFFCIGREVQAHSSFWHAWSAAGFPMANHTYYHTSLTAKSFTTIVAELKRANAAVTKVIGRPMLPVLRPMGGNVNSTVVHAAGTVGEKLVLNWDISLADTSAVYAGGKVPSRTLDYINDLIHNGERGTNGSVILMHAKGPYTQQALPSIIAFYKARHYQFVTIGQMFHLGGVVPFPGNGL